MNSSSTYTAYQFGSWPPGDAVSSKNRHLQALRRFFRVQCREGIRTSNPAVSVRSTRTPKRLRPLSLHAEETQLLLAAAGKSSYGQGARNYALVQLMLSSGLRVSEVASLVGDDLEIGPRGGNVTA